MLKAAWAFSAGTHPRTIPSSASRCEDVRMLNVPALISFAHLQVRKTPYLLRQRLTSWDKEVPMSKRKKFNDWVWNLVGGKYLMGNQLSKFAWYRGWSDNSKYALELCLMCAASFYPLQWVMML